MAGEACVHWAMRAYANKLLNSIGHDGGIHHYPPCMQKHVGTTKEQIQEIRREGDPHERGE